MKILVTGGAGFIGSHVCKAFAAKGILPITYDNLSRGNRWAVKWGPLEEGDILNGVQLRVVLKRYDPAAVMHFAAYAYVAESVEKPLTYYNNNVVGAVSLLQAMIEHRRMPFVFSSTCATYGVPDRLPISEEQTQRPVNPYGFSKLVTERMLTDLGAAHGFQSISLRYFNAAGADPEGEIGESHDPETHLIPLAIQAACTGSPMYIFGDDYDTPDGTCVRDYVHVSDIADAHVRALEYLMAGGVSCCLNLSNRRGYSVKEVIKTAAKICDRPIRVEVGPRRIGDPAVLIGDAQRARTVLGWQPNRSELENQISDARNWVMKLKPSMKQKNGTPSLPPVETIAQFEGGKLWTAF